VASLSRTRRPHAINPGVSSCTFFTHPVFSKTENCRSEGRHIRLVRSFSKPRKQFRSPPMAWPSAPMAWRSAPMAPAHGARINLNDWLSGGSLGYSPKKIPANRIFLPLFPMRVASLRETPLAALFGRTQAVLKQEPKRDPPVIHLLSVDRKGARTDARWSGIGWASSLTDAPSWVSSVDGRRPQDARRLRGEWRPR
jgi:hypothetical protein